MSDVFASCTCHAVAMHVDLELSGTAANPLVGQLIGPDGVAISFTGRLGLLGALEQMIARQADAPAGDAPSAIDVTKPLLGAKPDLWVGG